MSGVVRVAVRSPEAVVEAGLTALLHRHQERVQVVAATAGPDVLLYDVLSLSHQSENDLAEALHHSGCAVIVVDRGAHPHLLARAFALGASARVTLGVSAPDLADAVERASRKEAISTADLVAEKRARLGSEVGLTDRESNVLALIALGLTNQQIATELYVSINSVKSYIRQTYRKIGAVRRSQAVNWAVRHGFPLIDVARDTVPRAKPAGELAIDGQAGGAPGLRLLVGQDGSVHTRRSTVVSPPPTTPSPGPTGPSWRSSTGRSRASSRTGDPHS